MAGMDLLSEERLSDSPLVEKIWYVRGAPPGVFTSQAESHWEMVVTRVQGRTTFTVRGPETLATPADTPPEGEFFGIVFRLGVFMPHIPLKRLRDRRDLTLPEATNQSFWLLGSAWQIPTYANADTFIDRMVRTDLLVRDPMVVAVLQGRPPDASPRTVQRRFVQATGLTHKTIQQIERARQAAALLASGTPILDAAFAAGYYDQAHLTNALKHLTGQTPAQIAAQRPPIG